MTVNKIMQIQKMGDHKGSALKELALFYGCEDFDLSSISNDMADKWIRTKQCQCFEPGSWVKGYDTCMGTKEREPCSCKGDRTKCDFYKKEWSHD